MKRSSKLLHTKASLGWCKLDSHCKVERISEIILSQNKVRILALTVRGGLFMKTIRVVPRFYRLFLQM